MGGEKGGRKLTWYQQAACRGLPTEWWYPPRDANKNQQVNAAQAKLICKACPVRTECLQYADHNHEQLGIWGGKPAGARKHGEHIPTRIKYRDDNVCARCGTPTEHYRCEQCAEYHNERAVLYRARQRGAA